MGMCLKYQIWHVGAVDALGILVRLPLDMSYHETRVAMLDSI